MKTQKLSKKQVTALVKLAAASALDRLAEDENDQEAAETLQNSMEYLKSERGGRSRE